MALKITHHSNETDADSADRWTKLIGLDLLDEGAKVLGYFLILRVEDSKETGVRKYIIKDNQEHLFYIKTNNGKVFQCIVYNRAFTVST